MVVFLSVQPSVKHLIEKELPLTMVGINSAESTAAGLSWVLKQNFQRPSSFPVIYKMFLAEVAQSSAPVATGSRA